MSLSQCHSQPGSGTIASGSQSDMLAAVAAFQAWQSTTAPGIAQHDLKGDSITGIRSPYASVRSRLHTNRPADVSPFTYARNSGIPLTFTGISAG